MERILNASMAKANKEKAAEWTVPPTVIAPTKTVVKFSELVFEPADAYLAGEIEWKRLAGLCSQPGGEFESQWSTLA